MKRLLLIPLPLLLVIGSTCSQPTLYWGGSQQTINNKICEYFVGEMAVISTAITSNNRL